MSLMRLAYASEATFDAQPLEKGVEPHVARILMASRRNNGREQIVGGLYYGDNRFFQYLEGDTEAVRATFQRIRKDPRHRNIRTLIEEPIEERTFSNWSMKYVPMSGDVQAFLDRHQLDGFNPAEFNGQQCEEMIDLIRQASEGNRAVHYDNGARTLGDAPETVSSGLKVALVGASVLVIVVLIVAAMMY